MKKGMALIKARDLVGPSGSVQQDGVLFYVLVGDAMSAIAVAHSWDQVLKLAADSPAARKFHDEQVRIANEIGEANKSLAATAMAIAKKKFQDFMGRQANDELVKVAAAETKIEADIAWQKKRDEDYQAALYRTRAREAGNTL